MRNTRWLRYGLASIIVAGTGLGATLVACGDDESGSSSGNLPDATPADSPTGDTNTTDAADAAKPTLAKLTFVNATTDMGPNSALNGRGDAAIRICFKQGTNAQNIGVAPLPPLPDKPRGTQTVAGIVYGTGGSFPSFGLDLEGRIIVPIVMNVRSLVERGIKNPGTGQPGTTCDELVGDNADAAADMLEGKDYWTLPQIEAETFKKEKSYILALTGCVGDATVANGEKCGPGFTPGAAGVGNLKVHIFETNTTPVSATQLGVQFFHASAQTDAILGSKGAMIPLTPGFMTNPNDASTFNAAVPAPIVLHTLTPAQGVTGVTDSNFFVLDKTSPTNPLTALAPFPLPVIQALSGLGAATAPTVYKDGANYVFLAVGDPTEATFTDPGSDSGAPVDGGAFNTKSLHFLAFPTDPVIEPYSAGP